LDLIDRTIRLDRRTVHDLLAEHVLRPLVQPLGSLLHPALRGTGDQPKTGAISHAQFCLSPAIQVEEVALALILVLLGPLLQATQQVAVLERLLGGILDNAQEGSAQCAVRIASERVNATSTSGSIRTSTALFLSRPSDVRPLGMGNGTLSKPAAYTTSPGTTVSVASATSPTVVAWRVMLLSG
jgi:hypothetical protein